MKLPEEILEQFRKAGATGGKKRSTRLSAARRREIAIMGGKARWPKKAQRS